MNAVPFDTLKMAERLEAGGFTAQQSRTFASALADAASTADGATKSDLVNLATKADLDELKIATKADIAGLKADFDELRSATKADINELRIATQADIAGLKADINELKIATKADINELRMATKADTAELKADLLKWIVSAIGLQTVVTIGAVITLMRLAH